MSTKVKQTHYNQKTKLEAVRLYLEEDLSVTEIMNKLDIRHRDNIYEWVKKYRKNGAAAFDRSLMSRKQTSTSSTEAKVEQLRVEVEILKKSLEIYQMEAMKKNTN